MKKPSILITTPHYTPAFRAGGPIKSIANLIEALGDEFEFNVITLNHDFGCDEPLVNAAPMDWLPVGKARVTYFRSSLDVAIALPQLLRSVEYDVLYLNSFFNPVFTALPLVLCKALLRRRTPIVLAPRGEFSPGAIRLKPRKKAAYLKLFRLSGLGAGIVWEASSELERDDIVRELKNRLRTIELAVVGNILCAYVVGDIPDNPFQALSPMKRNLLRTKNSNGQSNDILKIVFLSRISRMKNLDFALRVLTMVTEPVCFTIIGPREDPVYAQECDALLGGVPPHIILKEEGPIEPGRVVEELSRHDLFFLPTHGENFGHVIAEALQAGLRVLISDQTPWRGLEREGVGFDLPLDDPAAFARTIEAQARSARDPYQVEKNNKYLSRFLRRDERVEAARTMFQRALAG